MRTALCFQDGNFVGREYYARLVEAGRAPDLVVAVGRMKPESIAFERERTGGLWNPPLIPESTATHRFASLADPDFARLLRAERIDVAIQGGIGILRGDILNAPRIGWINVHPGALPIYRGSSCPEWAIHDGAEVVATAHLIDAGLDTGPVICTAPYPIEPSWDYAAFRAHLYRHCAVVLLRALELLSRHGPAIARPQPPTERGTRETMNGEQLASVRATFPRGAAFRGSGP